MEDKFEATFVLDITPEGAWSALEAYQQTRPAPQEPPAYQQWVLPGFPIGTGEVLEMEPGALLRLRKDTMPCVNSEILVTFEAVESGTRVTVVQSGFGTAFWQAMRDTLAVGALHIFEDFALWLERGVDAQRHMRPWASLGCYSKQTPLGLEVTTVRGGFAERAGIQPGDILLTVGGAPIGSETELATVLRIFKAGDEIKASWVRGRQRMSAVAVV